MGLIINFTNAYKLHQTIQYFVFDNILSFAQEIMALPSLDLLVINYRRLHVHCHLFARNKNYV